MGMIEEHPELIQIAASYLGISLDVASSHCREVEEDGILYVWEPERGGGTLLIGGDGDVLFANSSVNFDDHLQAFRQGKRTDPEKFSQGPT
jgi:hypothetical protein